MTNKNQWDTPPKRERNSNTNDSHQITRKENKRRRKEQSESCSVMSNSLQPYGLYSPWNSPGQNTEGGSYSLLQGISQPKDQTQVSHIAGRFFTSWATREAQEYWSGSLSLLQWIFPTQELNPGLLHCRQILYQLSYHGISQKQLTQW